jgi:hypothetical protein
VLIKPQTSIGNHSRDLQKVVDQQQAQIEELRSTIARLEQPVYSEANRIGEVSRPVLSHASEYAAPKPVQTAGPTIRTPDNAKLLEAGLTEAQAAAVTQLATGTGRYSDSEPAPENLRNEIVSQLGEEAYDGYLYATGQSNRLVVSSTATSETGIESGDRLHSLDGQRIYSTNDLKAGISSDQAADWLSLTVERNGEAVMLYIPKDNIGFRVERQRVNPVEPAG